MSELRTVNVFNEETGKWSKLKTKPNPDGSLNMDLVREAWRTRRRRRGHESADIANGDDDEDDESFEITEYKIPEGVQYVVPVVGKDELAEIKRRRREQRLKRQLSINMKY